jgi:hypothetical protein
MAKEKILLIQLIQLSAFYFLGESWDRHKSSLPSKFVNWIKVTSAVTTPDLQKLCFG